MTGLPLQNILAKAKELLHSVQPMIRPSNLPDATPPEHLIPLPHYTLGISRLFSKLSKYLKLKDKFGQGPLKNIYPLEDQDISRLPEAEPLHEMEWMSHPHFSRFGRTPEEQPKLAGLGCSEDTAVVTEEKDKREEDKLYFTRMGRSSWQPPSLLGPAGGRGWRARLQARLQASLQARLQASLQGQATQGRENKFIRMAKRAGQVGLGKREKIVDKLFFTRPG